MGPSGLESASRFILEVEFTCLSLRSELFFLIKIVSLLPIQPPEIIDGQMVTQF